MVERFQAAGPNGAGPNGEVYGQGAYAPQEHTALEDVLALQLKQVNADVTDQLVNNDHEKKFFQYGDTVKIVAIDPNSVKIEARDFKTIVKPQLSDISFSEATMTIDKSLAYGFKISHLTRIEEKWNRESALTTLAGQKLRETHNLLTLDLILSNTDIPVLGRNMPIDIYGTALAPKNPAEELFKIVNAVQMQLERSGAVDRNGQYSFGANPTEQLRASASMFIAPELKLALLNSQYTRIDDVTESVIRDGKYEKFGGFILNTANELSTGSNVHCAQLAAIAAGFKSTNIPDTSTKMMSEGDVLCAIVVGTKNLVTRASRALPIRKQESEVEFADKYTCMEIYGEMVAVPQAGVVVLVKVPADKMLTFGGNNYMGSGTNKDARTLNLQYKEELPYVNVPAVDSDVVTGAPYASIGRDVVAGGFANNTGYGQYGTPAEPADSDSDSDSDTDADSDTDTDADTDTDDN